jgi:hypothetical protein
VSHKTQGAWYEESELTEIGLGEREEDCMPI